MLRAWRETPGTKECSSASFTIGLSREDQSSQKNREPRDETHRLEALKQGSIPCTWNVVDFKFYFS